MRGLGILNQPGLASFIMQAASMGVYALFTYLVVALVPPKTWAIASAAWAIASLPFQAGPSGMVDSPLSLPYMAAAPLALAAPLYMLFGLPGLLTGIVASATGIVLYYYEKTEWGALANGDKWTWGKMRGLGYLLPQLYAPASAAAAGFTPTAVAVALLNARDLVGRLSYSRVVFKGGARRGGVAESAAVRVAYSLPVIPVVALTAAAWFINPLLPAAVAVATLGWRLVWSYALVRSLANEPHDPGLVAVLVATAYVLLPYLPFVEQYYRQWPLWVSGALLTTAAYYTAKRYAPAIAARVMGILKGGSP